MTVHWVGTPDAGVVKYGGSPDRLIVTAQGQRFQFLDTQHEKRNYTMHIATMKGLLPNTDYFYSVQAANGARSQTFRFRSNSDAFALQTRGPMTYAVYGDMGDFNAQSLPSLKKAANARALDMVLHVGDFAYDMDSDNGRNGDAFMRDIQELAATVPYMVSHGNHENTQNFNHYTQRFRNMPSNSGTIRMPEFGEVPNNWWYSWDHGLVHFVTISTEVYFFHPELVARQWRWLDADLRRVDRRRTPWLIVNGHRPLYCSCDGDCIEAATTNRMGLKGRFGRFEYGLEQLFFKRGGDLYIAGHEHDYERVYDIAPHFNKSYHLYSGRATQSTVDPPATTYIVTGSAGCVEEHEPFTIPQMSRSASRLNTYGWSRMVVENASHIFWQQIQTDSGGWEKVADETWIVQHSHGPFAAHPRRQAVAVEERGSDPGAATARLAARGSADLRSLAQCCHRHGHGGSLVCSDKDFESDLRAMGHWQASKKQSSRPQEQASKKQSSRPQEAMDTV